jgi:alpha-tubulin suppressor-like RCC1 family protein
MKLKKIIGLGAIALGNLAHPSGAYYNDVKDLRIFLNYDGAADPNVMLPHTMDFGLGNGSVRTIPPLEIEHQVRLGLGLWQSVLPEMNFRFVDSRGSENLRFDFMKDCRDGFGQKCGGINYGNLIGFDAPNIAGADINYIDNRLVDQYLAWVFNPDLKHWGPAGSTTCDVFRYNMNYVNNQAGGCVDFKLFPRVGELKGSDLGELVLHEFGHSLVPNRAASLLPIATIPPGQDGHTVVNQMTVNDNEVYFRPGSGELYDPAPAGTARPAAYTRNPIYQRNFLVRRRADGYSAMWSGNGTDLYNCRGIFPIDVHNLINEGYRVTYPNISGVIVLGKRSGRGFTYALSSNWDEVRNMQIWPNQGAPLTDVQAANAWFLIDIHPRSQTRKTLAAGERHTLAIRENGSLWAWGANNAGQLGDGTTNVSTSPKQISAGPWVAVTAGLDFSLGIKSDGSLWAWGDNSQGQMGDPALTSNQLSPRQIGIDKDWLGVSAGALHVVAIKKTGKAYGWGYNADAELGIGNTASPQRSPALVCPTANCQTTNFISVSGGANHTLALDDNGRIWGWGSNANGQLTSVAGTTELQPVLISASISNRRWSSVEAGHEHSSGLSNGRIYTWGKNSHSQLGQGFTGGTQFSPAQEATTSAAWASLFSGNWHTGGTLAYGAFQSWGYNNIGQLGNNSTAMSSRAVQEFSGILSWVQGAARQLHTVGLRADGTLWGWGSNGNGELGTGGTSSSSVPVKTKFVANTLSVTQTTYSTSSVTTVDLPSVGSMNWMKWNTSSSTNSKLVDIFVNEYRVLQRIGTYSKVPAAFPFTEGSDSKNFSKFNWVPSDETSGMGGSNVATGVSAGIITSGSPVGRGFQLSVPVRNASRTLYVYVGAYRASGKMEVSFDDGSVSTYTNTSLNNSGSATTPTNGVYAITFSSLNENARLIVKWTMNAQNTSSGDRHVTLQAAAIK